MGQSTLSVVYMRERKRRTKSSGVSWSMALKAVQGIRIAYDLVGFIPLEELAKEETA